MGIDTKKWVDGGCNKSRMVESNGYTIHFKIKWGILRGNCAQIIRELKKVKSWNKKKHFNKSSALRVCKENEDEL